MTAIPGAFEIIPTGPLSGSVAPPASKSVTNRLLLLASLADGTSVLRNPLVSNDSAAMRDVVTGLGAAVADVGSPGEAGYAWHVSGTGGRVSAPDAPLDCRLSGTTIRFATAVAALADGEVTLTGEAPLRNRPIGPLVTALRDLGAAVATDHDGYPPVTVGGGLAGGEVAIDVTGSSQYASAVLLAAPYAREAVTVRALGEHAAAYVELTTSAMDVWGALVDPVGDNAWQVRTGGYTACDQTVEYDASAAAHLFGLATATGGRVAVVHASPDTLQPDAVFPDILARFGADVTREGDVVVVTGPDRPVAAGDIDLSDMPDQVTTCAAIAALADGVTTITGVEVARGHETDRLTALATELRKIGAEVEERPDGLVVDGSNATGHATLDTYDDHRLAMSFASVGARLPGVVIDDPGCVAKTYPGFWQALVRLGGEVRPA
ncbi:3-phosphoshikimate 1-carboxyvinyltransferase [Euzebya pacifica]|uniref:3-phosphoshikimate 1-carboxyvinyltransferase n=1 Tax=Euzebya pacifica TaxID=1608957 RepID=UPI0030FB511D